MQRLAMIMIAGAVCSSATAQESKDLCVQAAPHMRALAVESRQALDMTREMLPEGVQSDVRLGLLNAQKLRADARQAMPSSVPDEFIDAFVAGAALLQVLQQATERYEIAASALEACAAKADSTP